MATQPKPTKAELQREALAWAEYLYDLYVETKHKQLHLPSQDKKIQTSNKRGNGGKHD